MRIKEILSQHRRDFTAIYECEHCGYTEKGSGYDDTYFHQEVIPKKVCPSCKKVAPDSYRPLTTKYPDKEIH
jgi:rubrerythrin